MNPASPDTVAEEVPGAAPPRSRRWSVVGHVIDPERAEREDRDEAGDLDDTGPVAAVSLPGGDAPAPAGAHRAALPDDPDRRREAHRRRRRRRRRLRRSGLFLLCMGLAIAVPALLRTDVRIPLPAFGFGGSGSPAEETPTTLVAPPAVTTPTALLVHQGDEGEVESLTLLTLGRSGGGGDVVFVPVGSMIEVPAHGLERVGAAYELGGLALLQTSVENLLGLALDEVVVADGPRLESWVGGVGQIEVELPERVERTGPGGRLQVLFEAGEATVQPSDVPGLLEERGSGTDLQRLVRHQAFWRGWLAAVADAPPGTTPPGAAGRFVGALASGPVSYHLLPVEAMATGLASDGDLYRVDVERVESLVSRIVPQLGESGPRLRVQILNGTGEPGVADRVVPMLVPMRAAARFGGNADSFGYTTTQIVYYDADRRTDAEAVREALGVGEVVLSRRPLGVVDVTIVVGRDLTGDPDDAQE
jgi:hypothetical protein